MRTHHCGCDCGGKRTASAPSSSVAARTPRLPIEIVDSDETTLADDGRTDTDSDLTESDSDDLYPRVISCLPREVVRAQKILNEWHIRHAQQDADTEWDAHSVMHLKMPLLALSRDLDLDAAKQQVTARFITESQPSWEARGAAMLGE